MPFKLTATGDLERAFGSFVRLDEVADKDACIGQRIAIRLRRWRGEWSFDTRLGMDWETLLQKGTAEGVLRSSLIKEISKVPGVRAITSLDLVSTGSRQLSVTGRVRVVGSDEAVIFGASVQV